MLLEINGIKFTGFTSQSIRRSLDQFSGSFFFSATNDELSDFPIAQFSSVKVIVDNLSTLGGLDVQVLDGFVDIIDVNYDSNVHTINIQGRDKTAILIDSSVWDKKSFKKPINLTTIAQTVISDLGLSNSISVINEAGIIEDFNKNIDAEVGESAFSFLERLARQRQILLSTDGFGNVLLTKGNGNKIFTLLLHQKDNDENNVLSANITFDTSKRFKQYKVIGQSPDDEDQFVLPVNQTVAEGTSSDDDALSGKRLIVVAEEGIDLATAQKRSEWESNIRRAQSTVYKCRVQGHEHLQGIWDLNQLVRVVDDYAEIDRDMLIKSTEFIQSNDGTFTDLILVSPDAYTLETDVPVFEKANSKFFWE